MKASFKINLLGRFIPIKIDIDENYIRDYLDLGDNEDIIIDENFHNNIHNIIDKIVKNAPIVDIKITTNPEFGPIWTLQENYKKKYNLKRV